MNVATAAPLGETELASTLLPFGESTVLPAAAYTSPSVFAWEQRQLFAASWSCVGRLDDLRGSSGTQRALVVGDIPVLLTWPVDGTTRAFANTCRHRGHELLARGADSSRKVTVCPYHAWSYGLDGELIAAPGFRDVTSFDPAAHALVPLPVRLWHGWLFVNATATAASFDTHVGALEQLVSPYDPAPLVLGARHDYEVAANWKIVAENYHECYHCPLIHPELCRVSPPASGENYRLPGAWVGGSMDLRDDAETMSLDGRSHGVALAGADQAKVLYLGLLPNLLLSLHPDYVMAHRLEPIAADRTRIECSWYFATSDVDPSYAVEFWDRTNQQDWAACESVQRGVSSPHYRPGPLAPNEDAVHDFVTRVASAYIGAATERGGWPAAPPLPIRR